MTHARTSQDTPPMPASASRQTARGPADLRKSIKLWRKSCSNLWEAKNFVRKPEKYMLNSSTRAPRGHHSQPNPKQPPPANPHRPS